MFTDKIVPHQCWVQRDSHCPGFAGHTAFDFDHSFCIILLLEGVDV